MLKQSFIFARELNLGPDIIIYKVHASHSSDLATTINLTLLELSTNNATFQIVPPIVR